MFGLAFDSACRQRESHCGVSGACLSYDNWSIALNMFLVVTIVKGVSAIAGIVALFSRQLESETKTINNNLGCSYIAKRLADFNAIDEASAKLFLNDMETNFEHLIIKPPYPILP